MLYLAQGRAYPTVSSETGDTRASAVRVVAGRLHRTEPDGSRLAGHTASH